MSQTTYIIIGLVVVLLCCISSSMLAAYLYYRKPEEQKNKPGMIGGPCLADGTCSENNSVCKFNECYEKCVARKAFPCCTEGDISRIKTYWCDYSQCKPEGSPNDCDDITKEKGPSAFDKASQSLAETEAKKVALREQQAAEQKIAAEEAAKQAAATAKTQANLCKCFIYKDKGGCSKGKYRDDGSDEIAWCYVEGGLECEKTKPSSFDKGMGWRLCPNSDLYGNPF